MRPLAPKKKKETSCHQAATSRQPEGQSQKKLPEEPKEGKGSGQKLFPHRSWPGWGLATHASAVAGRGSGRSREVTVTNLAREGWPRQCGKERLLQQQKGRRSAQKKRLRVESGGWQALLLCWSISKHPERECGVDRHKTCNTAYSSSNSSGLSLTYFV